MDDKDVSGKMKRSEMEEMIPGLLERVKKTMKEILVNASKFRIYVWESVLIVEIPVVYYHCM